MEIQGGKIYEVLTRLPLFDDLFLRMQVQNVAVVDIYLRDIESELLRLYIQREKTPTPEAYFVSALSQMWIFALYELLRTWRQRVQELIKFGESLQEIPPQSRRQVIKKKQAKIKGVTVDGPGVAALRSHYEQVGQKRFLIRLKKWYAKTELIFRDVEAIRITVAKHEVPKTGKNPVPAYAPGYARIDPFSGSMTWTIESKDGMSDMISRQRVVDGLLNMNRPRSYRNHPH